jgi:hypothetical protein
LASLIRLAERLLAFIEFRHRGGPPQPTSRRRRRPARSIQACRYELGSRSAHSRWPGSLARAKHVTAAPRRPRGLGAIPGVVRQPHFCFGMSVRSRHHPWPSHRPLNFNSSCLGRKRR